MKHTLTLHGTYTTMLWEGLILDLLMYCVFSYCKENPLQHFTVGVWIFTGVKPECMSLVIVLDKVEKNCCCFKYDEVIARMVDEDRNSAIWIQFDEPWFLMIPIGKHVFRICAEIQTFCTFVEITILCTLSLNVRSGNRGVNVSAYVLVINRWIDSLQLLQKDRDLETIGGASGIEEKRFCGGRHRLLNV